MVKLQPRSAAMHYDTRHVAQCTIRNITSITHTQNNAEISIITAKNA